MDKRKSGGDVGGEDSDEDGLVVRAPPLKFGQKNNPKSSSDDEDSDDWFSHAVHVAKQKKGARASKSGGDGPSAGETALADLALKGKKRKVGAVTKLTLVKSSGGPSKSSKAGMRQYQLVTAAEVEAFTAS